MTDKQALKILQKNYDKLVEEFAQYKKESIKWSVEDIIDIANLKKYECPKEKAQIILEDMIHHHDASIGISWDTIIYYVHLYFDK